MVSFLKMSVLTTSVKVDYVKETDQPRGGGGGGALINTLQGRRSVFRMGGGQKKAAV